MAAVTVELIKQLRDRTGAGLMDCKGALIACDGDLNAASDYLREKGLIKAAKKAGRIAAEGLALTKVCEKCGSLVILEVNCETDFVAKGDAFHQLVEDAAGLILSNRPASLEEAKELTTQLFTDATVKIGEKLDLRRFEVIQKEEGQSIFSYIHMGGKIAAAVVVTSDDAELGKGLAMGVASYNPQYLTVDDIPADAIAHEKSVQLEAAKNDPKLAGKPAEMLEKIIDSKVKKYFAEMVFMLQPYIYDETKTVEDALKAKGAKLLKIVRFAVGEGIEKRADDFAAEVMSQIK